MSVDWLKTACARLGPIPESYVAFDVETTGLSPKSDLLAEIAFLYFEAGTLVREETIWIDHISPMLPTELSAMGARLEATRQSIENKNSSYQTKYAVTFDRMRQGLSLDQSRQVVRAWLDFVRTKKLPLAAHNAPFDLRFVQAFLCDLSVTDGLLVFDTDVVERAVQARPPVSRMPHRDWFDFSRNCSGLGGSKYRSNLSDWCDSKYGWHARGLVDMNNAHEARCDAWLTHLLIQEFRSASQEARKTK